MLDENDIRKHEVDILNSTETQNHQDTTKIGIDPVKPKE